MDMKSSFARRVNFASAKPSRPIVEQLGQSHPRALNIMLMVSDETHDRTIADRVRPSAENRDTMARSDRIVASGVIERVWVRVVDMGNL